MLRCATKGPFAMKRREYPKEWGSTSHADVGNYPHASALRVPRNYEMQQSFLQENGAQSLRPDADGGSDVKRVTNNLLR